ncbi:MAG: DinB family protein [Actinomycetota bacterium]|nr:DinB family protein [Actinomycetota bacterium]
MPIERIPPDEAVEERSTLNQRLDFLRATVARKASGLTEEQARNTALAPSELCIAGVVKHLTGVERFWFSIDFAGFDLPRPWPEDDPHGCFPLSEDDTIDGLVDAYLAECERSRQAIDGAALDAMAQGPEMTFNLRYALVHMIEETARHCGHLDLLREHLDGSTGQ